ncbi:MAG: LysR family transcriptional regulator [Alphaproteobacteria bacterium]
MAVDWDKLKTFYLVAETGSFTQAMNKLNLSQSAISRQISGLEESLGIVLFHRHARGIVLTEQGRILYNTASEMYHKITTTQENIIESKDRPSGVLKVNTTVAVGSMLIAPMMEEFKERYPDIEVHIVSSNKQLDLAKLEADIAILQHPTTLPGMVQKKLYHGYVYAYASMQYLERKGTPNSKNLDRHNLIVFDQTLDDDDDIKFNWLLELAGKKHMNVRPYLSINNLHGMYRMVRSGAGIAALPEFMEGLPGEMQKVLPEEKGPEYDIYVMYPEEYRNVQKVQVFKDFLIEKSKQ